MQKINLITKNIFIEIFSLILVFSSSFRKDACTETREDKINLRRLDTSDNLYVPLFLVFCFWGLIFIILFVINLYKYSCFCCSCELEAEEQPNELTILYFSLISNIIASTFIYFIFGDEYVNFLIFVYEGGGLIVIWSIIYLVKCYRYPEIYCEKVCECEYLIELAKYPLKIYIPCLREDTNEDNSCCRLIYALPYIYITAIHFYIFLPIFILFWLCTKMFIYCNCCDCCKCCSKKKKIKKIISSEESIPKNQITPKEQIIHVDNIEQIHVIKYEAFVFYQQNTQENNSNNANDHNINAEDDNY